MGDNAPYARSKDLFERRARIRWQPANRQAGVTWSRLAFARGIP